jgi:hypothetical protein
VRSLGYSKGDFIILHILFSVLEIKVYSIIFSKVFGVAIVVNVFVAIVKYMFINCKRIVNVEKMEIGNFGGEGERMHFDSFKQ